MCLLNIRLNIELKFNGHEQRLVEQTVEIVHRKGFGKQCVLSSLNHEALSEVERLDSRLKTGAILGAFLGDVTQLDVDFLAVNKQYVTSSFVETAHSNGKTIHVWTVNDRETMTTMLNLGVDNIMTDDPPVLVGLLRERAELSGLRCRSAARPGLRV